MQALLCKEVQLPKEWVPMQTHFKPELIDVSKLSMEYGMVSQKIYATIHLNITKIVRVQNPFLWGCYELKKSEYSNRDIHFAEKELFHTTGSNNILSIITNNLNWRKCKRGKFGQGVSFSPFAAYCDKYANRASGENRAIILCTVLVGRTTGGYYGMKIPSIQCDTSIGKANQKVNVYVKYDDYEFYPKYIVFYNKNHINDPFSSITLNSSQYTNHLAVVKGNDKENDRTVLSSAKSNYMVTSTSVPKPSYDTDIKRSERSSVSSERSCSSSSLSLQSSYSSVTSPSSRQYSYGNQSNNPSFSQRYTYDTSPRPYSSQSNNPSFSQRYTYETSPRPHSSQSNNPSFSQTYTYDRSLRDASSLYFRDNYPQNRAANYNRQYNTESAWNCAIL